MSSTVARSDRAEALLLDGEVCALLRIGETDPARPGGRHAARSGAVVVTGKEHATLVYDGPTDPKELAKIAAFQDVRPVTVGTAKVPRCRPIFAPPWGATGFELAIHADFMAVDDLLTYIERAGMLVGVGDGRPIGMGRFSLARYVVADA